MVGASLSELLLDQLLRERNASWPLPPAANCAICPAGTFSAAIDAAACEVRVTRVTTTASLHAKYYYYTITKLQLGALGRP